MATLGATLSTTEILAKARNLVTTTAATYNATSADDVIIADTTINAITVNLPAAAGLAGYMLRVKKVGGALNNVTIDGNSSETIDGLLTNIISTLNASVTLVCDGSQWRVI